MKLDSFRNLLLEELRDIYDGEKQLLSALPRMAESAVLPALKQAFMDHLEATERHAQRIREICGQLNESPEGNPCKTMRGLIEEAEDLIKTEKQADPGVLEAALIGAAQKVEHWEIAAYGCARTYAQLLGLDEAAGALQQTLVEEREVDRLLNEIAMQSVNPEAVAATSEEKALKEAVMAVLEISG